MAAGSAAGQNPNNAHPGNDYYVQPSTGTIQRQSNPVAAGLLQAAGFQGPMTWEQAQGVLDLAKKVQQTGAAPITGTAGEAVTGQTGALPNPLAALGSLEAFYKLVTDGKLWRSLGWLLLGIALMLLGVLLWIGPSAARRSPAGIAAQTARNAALLCRPRLPSRAVTSRPGRYRRRSSRCC